MDYASVCIVYVNRNANYIYHWYSSYVSSINRIYWYEETADVFDKLITYNLSIINGTNLHTECVSNKSSEKNGRNNLWRL